MINEFDELQKKNRSFAGLVTLYFTFALIFIMILFDLDKYFENSQTLLFYMLFFMTLVFFIINAIKGSDEPYDSKPGWGKFILHTISLLIFLYFIFYNINNYNTPIIENGIISSDSISLLSTVTLAIINTIEVIKIIYRKVTWQE